MAYDLILRRETDRDLSINLPGSAENKVLPLEFSPAESRALKLLEASTRAHVIDVIGWARSHGLPARLSTNAVIYTPEMAAKHYQEGRSGIAPGRLDWHQVGRAYHLVIVDPKTKQLDAPAYERVARYVRSVGGEWLGDKKVITPKGPVVDLAHFEYHPDFDIATYRKMPLAQVEYKNAQARAVKYG
jgi:hypothetical protein